MIGAADGAEALRLAASWHFDLVVTAPEPSKVPGTHLLRILRGGLLSSKVRVLLQVEHFEEAEQARQLVDGVLIKNGQFEKQLQRKLEEWFGIPRPRPLIECSACQAAC